MKLLRNGLLLSFAYFSLYFPESKAQVKNDSIPQIDLPEVVISALRLPFKESSVPYSISLVNTRINTQGLSLSESLASLPGLIVNARYNYAVGDRITNRGFGARTQFGVRGVRIIFDDVPVTFADGQSNLEMIDLQNLSSAEFLRGPGSSLYGNASGGVLLLRSRQVGSDRFLAEFSTSAGSNGLLRLSGKAEGTIRKTAVSLSYTDFHYSGFRDHAISDYNRIFLKSYTEYSAKDNLLIEAGNVKFNALNPGSLTRQEYDLDPHKANPASISNGASQDGRQSQFSATWKHSSDSISDFRLTVYGIYRSVINPIIGKIVVLPQYSGGAVISYNSALMIGRQKIEWSAGSEIALRYNDRKNYLNISGEQGNLIIDQRENITAPGLFIQGLLNVTDKFKIDACLRYDLTRFVVDNHLADTTGGNPGDERNMSALSPSAGVIYRLSDNLRIFANISTSFETPTSTELVNRPEGAGGFNPDLNPATAIEYESGLRGYINKILAWDLAIYFISTNDELIPFQVPSAPGQDYYRNAGSTVHKGGEIALRFTPYSFLEFNATLTYTDASYKNFTVDSIDYAGNKIPGISLFHGVAELKLEQSQGFYFSLLLQSFSKMYVNDANSEYSKKYGLVDIGAGHKGISIGKNQKKNVVLSGGVANLFNIKYVSSVSVNAAAGRFYEPGPGRSFYVNASVRFGMR